MRGEGREGGEEGRGKREGERREKEGRWDKWEEGERRRSYRVKSHLDKYITWSCRPPCSLPVYVRE